MSTSPSAEPVADKAPAIPPTAICFFPDGDQWCCVFGDFINLQESPAGFGDSLFDAFADLKRQVTAAG